MPGDHGTCMSDEIVQKTKYIKNVRFLAHFDHWKLIQPTSVPDDLVTMGPVCLMKLTRKLNMLRALGFFLDFFPQLILTLRS